ncbi:MAG TPA: hypothetical protein DCK83_10045 [Gallionellaceae bacterium]|nr:hypothetical protein [Gallionellaceae bacterium]
MTDNNKAARPEPDGTTSHSTKPASGQVAGYVEGQVSLTVFYVVHRSWFDKLTTNGSAMHLG